MSLGCHSVLGELHVETRLAPASAPDQKGLPAPPTCLRLGPPTRGPAHPPAARPT